MRVPTSWRPVLGNPRSRYVVAVTVTRSLASCPTCEHPAEQAGVYRYATETAVVTKPGTTTKIPFWGRIAEWPVARMAISRTERRIEAASCPVTLLPDTDFPPLSAQGQGLYGRVDLWAEGVPISDMIRLVEGPLVDIDPDSEDGSISFTVTDGPAISSASLDPGFIEPDEFPQAPVAVLGTARRRILIGPTPYPLQCPQIDAERRRFYLCEPPTVIPPDKYLVNGVEIPRSDHPQVITRPFRTAPGHFYSEVVFPAPIEASVGQVGVVLAQGGAGFTPTSVLKTLASDIGRYRLTSRAASRFVALDRTLSFSVLQDSEGDVLSLISERLLPQTNLAIQFKGGAMDVLDFVAPGSDRELSIGRGLIYRLAGQEDKVTPFEDVYNVIEIQYRANSQSTQAAPRRFVLDERYPAPLGHLSAMSQKAHGRRFLSISALDLPSGDTVAGTDSHPSAVISLAAGLLQLVGSRHRSETYQMTWREGISVEENSRRLITDPDVGWSAMPCRAVDIEIQPFGPQVTWQTEDIPR